MEKRFPSKIILIVLSTFMSVMAPFITHPARASGLDFAVIHPGQPGTTADAWPVMAEMGNYVRKKAGLEQEVTGGYFNSTDSAIDFLDNSIPEWGIVSLEFFLEYAEKYRMTPVASTRPGGESGDIWRLAVGKDSPDDWRMLTGKVRGTMLYHGEVSVCLLFAGAEKLPFSLEGTSRPLRSIRAVSRGRLSGVILDRMQFTGLQGVSLASRVKVIHESDRLPASPVIWFGRPGKQSEGLVKILMEMKADPGASGLLKLLQTDGFGPPDRDLPGLREKINVCLSR
ncbi:MAG TPA: hypothetical protein EYP57_06685 [Thermodesulfobacteriaceae bacterium]|nr:hypothetical protein [Thermodesulfobacteriaceae bacterium]